MKGRLRILLVLGVINELSGNEAREVLAAIYEEDGYRCFKANLHSRRAKMFYIINKYNFYEGG